MSVLICSPNNHQGRLIYSYLTLHGMDYLGVSE